MLICTTQNIWVLFYSNAEGACGGQFFLVSIFTPYSLHISTFSLLFKGFNIGQKPTLPSHKKCTIINNIHLWPRAWKGSSLEDFVSNIKNTNDTSGEKFFHLKLCASRCATLVIYSRKLFNNVCSWKNSGISRFLCAKPVVRVKLWSLRACCCGLCRVLKLIHCTV